MAASQKPVVESLESVSRKSFSGSNELESRTTVTITPGGTRTPSESGSEAWEPTNGGAAVHGVNKKGVDYLTLFSRKAPTFESFMHVGKPNLGDKETFMAMMSQIWDTRLLANRGPLVLELEKRVASYLGVKHFVSTSNGTTGLEIAVKALGLTGEVIVPSFTFIATAHCLQWQGVTPVFADVDPVTHTLDPAAVERAITSRTTGIIGVHLWGQPCNVEGLQAVADKHGLKLMFDAAHAFGCSLGGRMIGNYGSCEVFSFHATKVFNSFEGGGIATNDDALASEMRKRLNFGFATYDKVVSVGTNGKMTEACAAAGLTNLSSLPSFTEVNRANYEAYRQELEDILGLALYEFDMKEGTVVNHQYVVVTVDEASTGGVTRDMLVGLLVAGELLCPALLLPGLPQDATLPGAVPTGRSQPARDPRPVQPCHVPPHGHGGQ